MELSWDNKTEYMNTWNLVETIKPEYMELSWDNKTRIHGT